MIYPKRHKRGKRGWKVSPSLTAERRPKFLHPRSFVSQDGHEILFGKDKTFRRREIFDRDFYKCRNCGKHVPWDSDYMAGWHHLDAAPHRHRCDCLENGVVICDGCHRKIHAREVRNPKVSAEEVNRIVEWAEGQSAIEQLERMKP